MTEEEARSLGCITFGGEDIIAAMAETIFVTHKVVAGMSKCFDPLSNAPQEMVDVAIGKIASAVNSCFGVIFGVDPDDRYGEIFSFRSPRFVKCWLGTTYSPMGTSVPPWSYRLPS